ncbi:MAG: histidine--tRNA ligase [Verrucomicrobia bacterium]|nr:histidine--tRNA ligase [Verrucomicrobiota bacterium]
MGGTVRTPKGMRDFSPEIMAKRNYIFNTIRKYFELYGFEQIETPAMELRETLTGKYGEEGDRLIFSVLNSGDFLKRIVDQELIDRNLSELAVKLSDKALRYDLTVPFARYVVQHQNEITFPFKRYQIQPVWRADRPQKGRYREFYQCDADIIGSEALINEVELIKIFDDVLSGLGLKKFSIQINNRKVLSGIAEVIGRTDKIVDITVAMDKLEKIGKGKVNEELSQKGLSNNEIQQIQPLFELKGSNEEVIYQLSDFLRNSEIGQEGIGELKSILNAVERCGLDNAEINIDVTLARGLDYYTGAIFEVITNEVKMGSICGGGRYADLTGIFGLKNMSGVGISFGADRIYDVMEQLNLFPASLSQSTQLLFVNFGEKEESYCISLLHKARAAGIRSELFPETAKLKKQLKYADQKNIPYVVMVGEEEMSSGLLSFKEMQTGKQEKLDFLSILKRIES